MLLLGLFLSGFNLKKMRHLYFGHIACSNITDNNRLMLLVLLPTTNLSYVKPNIFYQHTYFEFNIFFLTFAFIV
jgi:hypothetical protein